MSTTYILLTNEDLLKLCEGKEVFCSLDGTEFTVMLEHAYEDTYLKKKTDAE